MVTSYRSTARGPAVPPVYSQTSDKVASKEEREWSEGSGDLGHAVKNTSDLQSPLCTSSEYCGVHRLRRGRFGDLFLGQISARTARTITTSSRSFRITPRLALLRVLSIVCFYFAPLTRNWKDRSACLLLRRLRYISSLIRFVPSANLAVEGLPKTESYAVLSSRPRRCMSSHPEHEAR